MEIEQRAGHIFNGGDLSPWPESSPAALVLSSERLDAAATLAEAHGSDSLLVFRHGQLAFERYWNGKTATDVQQTFSGTKSIFSLLVGRSIERGYLKGLDQPVSDLVPEMPATLAQLNFHNIMAMQSGAANSMKIEGLGSTGATQLEIALGREIVAPPMSLYHYNNAPYRLLFTALERASGRDLQTLTAEEVFEPLDFHGSHWVTIHAVAESERFTGYQSIRMTPRDFAKSSQVIVDGGGWRDARYLPADYIKSLITAPTQANPSFGLFHHLNAGDHYRNFAVPDRLDRKLVPGAPDDTFLMFGAGGQVTIGVPSKRLVIVRTGESRGSIYEPDNYIAQIITRVVDATD